MPCDIEELQTLIGYHFNNVALLEKALTHKSFAAEIGSNEYNERMEFLGDSILSAVVADYLYHRYPDQDEGKLSQIKSQVVSTQNLSRWAKELNLGDFFYISRGEELNGGRNRESLLANTMEAVIAAMYLDSGYAAAKQFILCHMVKQRRVVINDPKSKLQELIQAKYQTLPDYRVLSESGPDHDKLFEVGVYLKKKLLGRGAGRCKKDAHQIAARKALKALKE
ncbi:MAG: ribonuclease III [Endomicrobiales bacterium]